MNTGPDVDNGPISARWIGAGFLFVSLMLLLGHCMASDVLAGMVG